MRYLGRSSLFMPAFVAVLLAAPDARSEKEKELLKTKARVAYLTADGKILVAASSDNVRLVYLDIKKSRLLRKKYEPIYLSPAGDALATVAIQPDGDSAVSLYDVATAKGKGLVKLPPAADIAFCVSPGGKTCVYGTRKDLVVIDVATAKGTQTLKDGGGQPWSTSFSPDGKLLACGTGSQKYQVTVWNMATFKPMHTFKNMPNVVQGVAFSQDSKLLAASSDEDVKVWDVATGNVVQSFRGPKDKLMRGVAFGNNGKILASACSNGIVTLWDTATGKTLDTINIGVEAMRVSMSADGKVLAVTAGDQMARVYDVSALVGK